MDERLCDRRHPKTLRHEESGEKKSEESTADEEMSEEFENYRESQDCSRWKCVPWRREMLELIRDRSH